MRANFNTVQDYIDALVAPARAQNKDRFFSYVTSIEEENAFFNEGSSAGFGFRLGLRPGQPPRFRARDIRRAPRRLGANIERGTEILGIGTTASNIQYGQQPDRQWRRSRP